MTITSRPSTKFVSGMSGFIVLALPPITTSIANMSSTLSSYSEEFSSVSINGVESDARPSKAFTNSVNLLIQRLLSGDRPSVELSFDEASPVLDEESNYWMRLSTGSDQY